MLRMEIKVKYTFKAIVFNVVKKSFSLRIEKKCV